MNADDQPAGLGQREFCLLHAVQAEKQAQAQGITVRDSRKRAGGKAQ
jgi:hypothetical protein